MILVTGGAGFIGSNFIRYTLDKTDHSVVNVDALTYAANDWVTSIDDPRYTFINATINDADTIYQILSDYEPEYIVNFAAESHVTRSISDPEDCVETNIMGTYSLLEAIRRYGKPVRLHHVSSDEVYGSLKPGEDSFTEQSRYNPSTPYAASKAAADHLVFSWGKTYGLNVTVSSSANNYGPGQHSEKLIPNVIDRAMSGQKITIHGTGKQTRDWLHVNDHCSAIHKILLDGVAGEKYNIGANDEVSVEDVVHAVCSVLEKVQPKLESQYQDSIIVVDDRPANDKRYSTNNSKIVNLGWKPEFSFHDSVGQIVREYVRG